MGARRERRGPAGARAGRWRSLCRLSVPVLLGLNQMACSIVTPMPLLELFKATGAAAGAAIQGQPGNASNTVYHEHAPFRELCIEYNPQAQIADVVPALQMALRTHSIESRVYDGLATGDRCRVWLKYSAFIEWDIPPLGEQYKPFVSSAALTLQTAGGQVLSSSHYALETTFGKSKWASTQDKLSPVVTALLTGFSH